MIDAKFDEQGFGPGGDQEFSILRRRWVRHPAFGVSRVDIPPIQLEMFLAKYRRTGEYSEILVSPPDAALTTTQLEVCDRYARGHAGPAFPTMGPIQVLTAPSKAVLGKERL